jgi:hypothetical protein
MRIELYNQAGSQPSLTGTGVAAAYYDSVGQCTNRVGPDAVGAPFVLYSIHRTGYDFDLRLWMRSVNVSQ